MSVIRRAGRRVQFREYGKEGMPDTVVYIRSQPRYGDQVVAFPTLYQLKQWWPSQRLRVVARDDVGRYYTSLPWVDEFVRVSSFREHVRCLPARANASINLHHSSERYGLVSLLRRPALRMGFRNNRLSDGAWTHSHPKNIGEYIGLANLRLLGTYRSFDPHQAALNCFRAIAEQRKRPVAPVDVVMIPGGGSGPFKRWSIAHYIRLADLLKTSIGRGTQFSFVLGPDEAAELELINSLRRPEFRIEYCRTIPELSALMLRARLIVANDCGPSHIAQGVGVPYVGVFNESNPEWFWQRPGAVDVVPDVVGAGINSIPPEKVLAACLAAIAADPVERTELAAA